MKLDQKGALDLTVVLVLIIVLAVGGFVAMQVLGSDDESDGDTDDTSQMMDDEQESNGDLVSETLTVEVPADFETIVHENLVLSAKAPAGWETTIGISNEVDGVIASGVGVFDTTSDEDSPLSIVVSSLAGEGITSLADYIDTTYDQYLFAGYAADQIVTTQEVINGRTWIVRTLSLDGGPQTIEYFSYVDDEVGLASISVITENYDEAVPVMRQIAASIDS